MRRLNNKYGLFKSESLKNKFIKNGYCIIPLDDTTVIDRIALTYQNFKLDTKDMELYASNRYGTFDENIEIHQLIKDIFFDEMNKHFVEYRFLIGHFLEKKRNTDIGFQLHQDWSVSDETQYLTAHVWIPHQDTNKQNGGMFVIPKSHTFFKNYRSGSLEIPRIERSWAIDKIIQPVAVKKGEMLVFHPALFHGSYPNQSNQHRIVTLINIVQEDAPLLYYHLNAEEAVEVYSLTQRALMSDLDMMIQNEIPKDSVFIESKGKRRIHNVRIKAKDLLLQYFKSKMLYSNID